MKIASGLGFLGMEHWYRKLGARHTNSFTETVRKIKKGGVEMVIFDPFTLNQALGGTSGIFTNEVKTKLASLFSETLQSVPLRYLVYDSYYSRRFEGMKEFSVNGELIFHRMMYLSEFVRFCDDTCADVSGDPSE